ncbi:MFS transporter [Niveibacterium sp. 24ML]|uniref:MFS transporter n=1 Tax=Niveibacterium sp. 24ML TaxID=2985512 RepID=UPI002270972F|nr:MFS transporter [Niveibacterium sp. 24ML]MCX9155785.1 MFS transporter [Niveibacterium sp. 24ML]
MSSPFTDRMSAQERRAGTTLAAIFALRMLGLFLILPVFSVFAQTLPGGSDLMWAGIALGAFGMVQAVFQVPFGMASDRFGRKPVIVAGLLMFAAGCALAAWAPNIGWMIVARALQGAGAISAAVSALAADLTREQHRTKVMAMIGSTIGLVFALSLVASPALYQWIGMDGMFLLTGALSLLAIPLLLRAVPTPVRMDSAMPRVPLASVVAEPQLAPLHFGVFAIHMIQMGMFLVVPRILVGADHMPIGEHWKIYLPVVLASFLIMVPAIIYAERQRQMRHVLLAAIGLILLTQVGFLLAGDAFWPIVGLLFVFFVGFNIVEASLPSLVSRIAPPQAKGAALGVYNTSQSIGAALGGAAGGAIASHFGASAVFASTTLLAIVWWLWARRMKNPPLLTERELAIDPHIEIASIRRDLLALPGVREAIVVPERRMAYLKINPERWDEASLHRLIGGKA